MEEVTEGINNICTVDHSRGYYVLRGVVAGYGGGRCCGEKISTLDLGQPRVVLGEGLKDIRAQRYRGDFYGRVCSHMTAKNAHSEFVDLSDIS